MYKCTTQIKREKNVYSADRVHCRWSLWKYKSKAEILGFHVINHWASGQTLEKNWSYCKVDRKQRQGDNISFSPTPPLGFPLSCFFFCVLFPSSLLTNLLDFSLFFNFPSIRVRRLRHGSRLASMVWTLLF